MQDKIDVIVSESREIIPPFPGAETKVELSKARCISRKDGKSVRVYLGLMLVIRSLCNFV